MENPFILNEKNLRSIPPAFIFIFILVIGLPAVAVNYFGYELSGLSTNLNQGKSISILVSHIRGYFIQVLLEWSAFSLAAMTTLLSFTQYKLAKDKAALIIGLTVLFSGLVEGLHILTVDGLTAYIIERENIDALAWTFANTMSGLILLFGLILFLKFPKQSTVRMLTSLLLAILLALIAVSFIYYVDMYIKLKMPEMWFKDLTLTRPYEIIYLAIYLIICIFLYPRVYRKYPTILTNCIFYMSVVQIATAIYLMALSTNPYDSAYNIAYFLKIIFYFVPFYCLILNYVFSYEAVLVAQERLKYLAGHDPLSNLYNRREFEVLLSKAINTNSREKNYFALFLLDIDNFKSINDTLGHIHGDNFLKKFSQQLSLVTRKGDIVSRIGGDEFTIISSKISSPYVARRLARRILAQLHKPYWVNDKLLSATVSVGVSIYPTDGETAGELLKNADIAMYNAKQSGKNTYCFYTKELSKDNNRGNEIESYLPGALKKNELRLVCQPIYNLLTKEIIGAEMLLRWSNPILGEVPPMEFIPIAENSHLIIQISNWVLEKACAQASTWLKKYKKQLVFAINVSPIQFVNNTFYPILKNTLEKYNYPGEALSIEITENLLLINPEELRRSLTYVHHLGVNIALDDFGTGYSSLSRLKTLPINTLKIDKVFVGDIKKDTDKISVVDTIIKLAQELNMNMIAEGIETEAQLNYLRDRSCCYGQGYYLSKPIPLEEFETLAYQQNIVENE